MKLRELFEDEQAGTFVGAKLTLPSLKKLVSWMDIQKIKNPIEPKDIHCTVIISPYKKIDWEPKNWEGKLKIDHTTYCFQIFGEKKDTLVLTFFSDELRKRNEQGLVEYDLENKFGDYVPHFTLSYEAIGADVSTLELPTFPLYLSHEYVTEFDPNWG
jgi:hypothetical protein